MRVRNDLKCDSLAQCMWLESPAMEMGNEEKSGEGASDKGGLKYINHE